MSSQLNAYLNFDGQTRAAMEFYQQVLGGDLSIATFGQYDPESPNADGVMHAMLTDAQGQVLMASDMPPGMDLQPGNNFSLSLSGDDDELLRGYWDALSDGGQVMMPLEPQMWGDVFGACVDKFGVTWMVNILGSQSSD